MHWLDRGGGGVDHGCIVPIYSALLYPTPTLPYQHSPGPCSQDRTGQDRTANWKKLIQQQILLLTYLLFTMPVPVRSCSRVFCFFSRCVVWFATFAPGSLALNLSAPSCFLPLSLPSVELVIRSPARCLAPSLAPSLPRSRCLPSPALFPLRSFQHHRTSPR